MKTSIMNFVKFLYSIRREIFTLFVITIFLFIIKYGIEHTYPGKRIELLTFELLQGRLSSFDPDEELPVVVVDISDISLINDKYTDREKLKEVIDAIAEQEPLAIGIDINFAPEKAGIWNTPYDEDFLKHCLELKKKGISIFLGVSSNMPLDNPNAWLGDKAFKDLATTIAIPRYREDTSYFPLWVKGKNQVEKLPSMSFALATEAEKKQSNEKKTISPHFKYFNETYGNYPGKTETENDIEYAEALCNYSKLQAIRQTILLNRSASSVEEFSDKFKDRIVILGYGKNASDNIDISISREPVAGVFVHACGIYTLTRQPMYEFKSLFRIFLDILFPLIVFFVVAAFRYKNRELDPKYNWHKLQSRIVVIGGIFIFLIAIVLVNLVNVLWLDFVLIVVAFLLHPRLERIIPYFWSKIWKSNKKIKA